MVKFLPSKVHYIRNVDLNHVGSVPYRIDDYVCSQPYYVDLLPKKLTLRRFSAKRFDDRLITLFKEVDVVPFERAYPVRGWTSGVFNAVPCRDETEIELLEALKTRLKEVVYETWKPGMAHAVLHSSGIDSRMLSWTIKELHKEHGDEWLGKVLFLCSKWESKVFYSIMAYQGWLDDQYYVPHMYSKDQEYYIETLQDFDGVWRRHDGPSAIPVNLFWYPVECAQIYLDFPTEDVQLYTGVYSNEIFKACSGMLAGVGLKKTLEKLYGSVLFRRPMKGDEVVKPFTDCKMARLIASSNVRLGDELRLKLLKYMDPRLAAFTNMDADADRHRRIHDDIISKIISDYDASWYGKNVMPGERPEWKTTEFQKFWSMWTTASLCEYLLASGYEIEAF